MDDETLQRHLANLRGRDSGQVAEYLRTLERAEGYVVSQKVRRLAQLERYKGLSK